MFIQTETTPNPDTLKFLPGCEVMINGTADFRAVEDAHISPLATRLFETTDITGVFLGKDFITITKTTDGDWEELKTPLLAAIMEHFTTGAAVITGEDHAAGPSNAILEDDDEIVQQIKELLETRVQPAVAMDGGEIVFDRFEDGIVFLQMRGACAGCPSSTATLKMGIENMLKHFIPEVEEVRPAAP